jgi:predicted acyl esterase
VVHSTQEWYDLYSPQRTADLASYFDRYLKSVPNDWSTTPPVRLALLNYTKSAIVDIPFPDLPWHLPSAQSRTLHLAPDLTLSPTQPSQPSTLTWQADSSEALSFTYTFPVRTALVGPSTLTVDISSPSHDDMDVYCHIFKYSLSGIELSNLNIPLPPGLSEEDADKATQNRVWRYWGPNGQLRASQRHVSASKSTKTWSTLSHEKVEKARPGEVVRLDVQMWPTGIVFEAGEQLVLKISGEKIGIAALPHLPKAANENRGEHVIHLGGGKHSSLKFFTVDV